MGKYDSMTVAELRAECRRHAGVQGMVGYSKMRKAELIEALEQEQIRLAGPGAPNREFYTPEEEPIPEPEPAKPVEVKGRSVGATTMAAEVPSGAVASKREPFKRYPNKQARNRAKARRRAIRAAGFQAGC